MCAIFSFQASKQHCCEHSSSTAAYQTVHVAEPVANGYAPYSQDIPLVEAYVVPPLAAAHPSPPEEALAAGATAAAPAGGFKDVWMAGLFLVHLIVIIAVASQSLWAADTPSGAQQQQAVDSSALTLIATFILSIACLSGLLASSVMYLIVGCAQGIIRSMLLGNVLCTACMAVAAVLALQPLPALFLALMTGLSYCYYLSVQDRIPFASALLSAACDALRPKLGALLLTSAAGLAAHVGWLVLWSAAAFNLTQRYRTASTSSEVHDDDALVGQYTGLGFLLIVSLYWTAQVIHYAVSLTAGGTVACWYFQPTHPAPVKGALFRALTSSFGSVCFGALILAVVQGLRYVVNAMKSRQQQQRDQRGRRDNRDNNALMVCALCLLDCLLRAVENAVTYINKYAYAYVAAYGTDFLTSGRAALALFERRGWTALINDNLISYTLAMMSFLLAALGAAMGALLLPLLVSLQHEHMDLMQMVGLGAGGGAVVALAVASAIVYMLDSAVAMIFVCFAEDPATLQAFHGEDFDKLLGAWQRFHPETIAWIPAVRGHGHSHHAGVLPTATPAFERDLELQEYRYQQQVSPQGPAAGAAASNPPPFNPSFSKPSGAYGGYQR